MRPQPQPPNLPLDAPCDVSAEIKAAWIEATQSEIVRDLRRTGKWRSSYRRFGGELMEFLPWNFVDQLQAKPDTGYAADMAFAAFWCAPEGADFGQIKLDAAAAIADLMDVAVNEGAKALAEREWEAMREQRNEH